jgi:hypothetical protein
MALKDYFKTPIVARERTLITAGEYRAMCTESIVKQTQKGNDRLNLTFEIISRESAGSEDPETFTGRRIYTGFNLTGVTNPQAERITRDQLAALWAAAGLEGELEHEDQILNLPLLVTVVVKPADDKGYPERNEITNYHKIAGLTGTPAATAPTRAAAPVANTEEEETDAEAPTAPTPLPCPAPPPTGFKWDGFGYVADVATEPKKRGRPKAPEMSPPPAASPAKEPPAWLPKA